MRNIFVIDAKPDRRSEVCRVLLRGDRHAEPFDTIEEFLGFAKAQGLALIHDESGSAQRLCGHMRETPQSLPVVGYAESPSVPGAVAAMQAGAASYLAWPFTLDEFTAEIDRIEPAMRERLERQRRVAQARSLLAGLTAREREVLVNLITHGTNKAIAKQLEISPRTVEKYRAAILVRLGVSNSAQAIRVAVEGGAFDASLAGDEGADAAAAEDRSGVIG